MLNYRGEPQADSDGKVVKYLISYKVKGGTFGSATEETTLSKTITNLQPKTTYIFKVQAEDDKGGLSEEGMSDEVTTKEDIVPLSFRINASKSNIVKGEEVIFEVRDLKGKAPFSYEWSSNLDGQLSTKERFKTTGLSRGNHRITLRVTDAHSSKSQTVDIGVTQTPPKPPTPPSDLRVNDETTSSFKLEWTASTDEDGEVVNYMVSYKKLTETDYSVEVPVGGRVLEYIFTGLDDDTNYDLKVRARDDAGLYSESKTVIGKTKKKINLKPPTPTNLKATEVKTTSLKVSWEASTDSDGEIAHYYISYKVKSDSSYKDEVALGKTTLTYTFTGSQSRYDL